MIDPQLVPMPPDLEDLLAAERGFPPVPEAVAERVLAGIATGLAGSALAVGQATAGSALGTSLGGALKASLVSKTAVAVALSFGLGTATGAALHARFSSPPPVAAAVLTPPAPAPQVPASEPVPTSEPVVPLAPAVGEAPAPAVAPARVRVVAPRPARSVPARDLDLADERSLLEMARTALGRGQSEAALQMLETHSRRFPTGQLVEERNGLMVLALVAAGRVPEARQRAESFRSAYPKSLLLLGIDAALEEDGAGP